ncbi:MAG: sulfatase-like hydrolase/transferase [Pirellulales bacterium]
MKRAWDRPWFYWAGVCLAWVMSVGNWDLCQGADGARRQPNILLVFTDDHALQAIGAYGAKMNQTPNIDRLAREGVTFHNSFCANSLCGPSRACILTGKHSHLNGFLRNGNVFDPHQLTFPPLLKQAGYQTAVLGKWHLESNPVGFDYWEILPDQGNYYNPDFIQMDGKPQRFTGYCTDLITDKAIEWLERRDPNRPFLLMCQHKAPHRNWAPHPRHFELFRGQKLPMPETMFDDYSGRSSLLKENEMTVAKHFYWGHDMKFHGETLFPEHFGSGMADGEYERMNEEQRAAWDAYYEPQNREFIARMRRGELSDREITEWKYQRYITDYLKCVAAVDDSVGRLTEYLDQHQLADNTIVIYASDQGFYLGEHGWYDKRWMFEESLKMPLIVRWPNVAPAGQRCEALVQNIDYGPTFLAAAGVPVPAEMQGRSLVPVLQHPTAPPADWRDAIYYAYYENAAVHQVPVHDGIRTDRYKLMFFPRTREWQLFDLKPDPQELTSVHADPSYATILQGMQQRYADLREFYQVNSAVIPATRGDEPGWRQRNQQLNQAARQGNHELVFIGDSITQGWEDAGAEIWRESFGERALNLGISGDRTEHVIWRLTHGNFAGQTPQKAVIMIGTNNTGHLRQDPSQVAAGVAKIVGLVRDQSPTTHVVLLGIFPRGTGPFDPLRLNNTAINDRLRLLADGQHVEYHDLSQHFLAEDGTIPADVMPDGLHLSIEGYRRWAAALKPILAAEQ